MRVCVSEGMRYRLLLVVLGWYVSLLLTDKATNTHAYIIYSTIEQRYVWELTWYKGDSVPQLPLVGLPFNRKVCFTDWCLTVSTL